MRECLIDEEASKDKEILKLNSRYFQDQIAEPLLDEKEAVKIDPHIICGLGFQHLHPKPSTQLPKCITGLETQSMNATGESAQAVTDTSTKIRYCGEERS